jgi:hypothetical protein
MGILRHKSALNAFVALGVSVCFCGLILAQPPKVAVDVATAATEASVADQPIMPDDYGQRSGTAPVMAKWNSGNVPVTGYVVPGVTLFTADDTPEDPFPCAPCRLQLRILVEAGGMTPDGVPIWPFKIKHVKDGAVPQWVPDNGDAPLSGPREAVSLHKWILAYAKSPVQSGNKYRDKLVVEVDGSDSHAVMMALAESIRRESDTQPAVTGFLPAIPVDVNDSLLKVLDSLLGKEGYNGGGLKVIWPAGNRKMTFEPGLQVNFKKFIEIDATVHSIAINGRDVTLSLSGTLVKELTVRLK